MRIGAPSAKRVIFGHGLGDTPHGWADVCNMWSKELPDVEFILPQAPTRPVTLNMGMQMPAWYDLPKLEDITSRLDVQAEGIDSAEETYQSLIENPAKTILAGFSQGAALALYTGLRWTAAGKEPLLGIMALSGYVPAARRIFEDIIHYRPKC